LCFVAGRGRGGGGGARTTLPVYGASRAGNNGTGSGFYASDKNLSGCFIKKVLEVDILVCQTQIVQ